MKKVVSIILTLLLLLPLVSSCDDSENLSSVGDNTSVADNSAADSSSETDTSLPEDFNNGEEIDALYVTELPENREYINIIAGKSYTLNRQPSDKFEYNPSALTAVAEPDAENDKMWLPFRDRDEIEITVDLGESYDGICGFSIAVMIDSPYGRGVPRVAQLYVSDDGEKYVKAINTGIAASPTSSTRTFYTLEGYSEKGFGGRYVKLRLSNILISWTFVTAFRVYTCTEKTVTELPDAPEYYQNEPLPEVTESIYWSYDDDGEKVVNLIRGLPQRFYTFTKLSETHQTSYYNVQPSTTALTDGKSGIIDIYDTSFAHFTAGGGREIIYDIGKLSSLQYATFSCMVDTTCGITLPEAVYVQLSEDAVEWQTVSYCESKTGVVSGKRGKFVLEFNADAYKARFVKFVFRNSSHTWVDELEVFGTKAITADTKTLEGPSASIGNDISVGSYPSLDVLGGSENIYLAYNYKVEQPSSGLRSKEQYLPLVGYYDINGTLCDFFFDSFLYLPCSTICPSGGKLWEDSSAPSFMSDWLDYEDDLYADGYNIKALNEAVGEIKDALGEPDYQAFVYLSIFNAPASQTAFGDVDGDGIVEDASKISDRKKIAKWWIDRNIANFENGGFSNLKLNGFYWYDESIGLSDPVKREMVDYIISYVHSLGYYIIWIPYFQASGYMKWFEVGFDCANMQPNYMFNQGSDIQRLYDNATLTKHYGMGVEIEADGNVFNSASDHYDRYMAYLRVGAETGYMNSIKMYYCDGVPGVFLTAYYSNIPKYHAIYDATYLYAKRKLVVEENVEKAEMESVTATANKNLVGNIVVPSPYTSATVLYGARHGVFSLNALGEYKYVPDENFVGYDTVVFTVTNGVVSTTATLTIEVTPNE